MRRALPCLLGLLVMCTVRAAPTVIEAETFDGLSLDANNAWILEYAPGASEGKQIQTGGQKPCEVRRTIRLTPGEYAVWARSWDTDTVDRSNVLSLDGRALPFGNHDHNGNWWTKLGTVRVPAAFEARIAVPAERTGCVHKVDAIAFADDEAWDPNTPETLPAKADAFCAPAHANADRWFVTSGGVWATAISYLNPSQEPAKDCWLRVEVPRGMDLEFGCMDRPWTTGTTITRPDWWTGHQLTAETVRIEGGSCQRYTLRFGPGFQMVPGWGTTDHNQIMWTRYYAPVKIWAKVGVPPGEYELRTTFGSSQGEMPPRAVRVTVLPLLAKVSAPPWSHIGMWECWRDSDQVDVQPVGAYFRTLRDTGFNETHIVSPDPKTLAAAVQAGLRVLDSGQHPYQKDAKEHPEASAVDVDGKPVPGQWCPTYLTAEQPGAKEALDRVAEALRKGCSGLYLDWEGPGLAICTCDRCREAFTKQTGLTELKWPDDVKPQGRYREPAWAEFRIAQHDRIVGLIRERMLAAKPQALLGAYSGWAYHGLPPDSFEVRNYRYGYGVDVATQAKLLDFFAPGFYAYADEALTGFIDTLTRMRQAIGKASLAPYLCAEWLTGEQDYWRGQTLYPFEIIRQEAGIALGFGCTGVNIYSGMAYDGRFGGLVNRYAGLLNALGEDFTQAEQCNDAVTANGFTGHLLARHSAGKAWCVLVPALAQTRAEQVTLNLGGGKAITRAWNLGTGEPLSARDGGVRIDVPPHDFAVCRLEANPR